MRLAYAALLALLLAPLGAAAQMQELLPLEDQPRFNAVGRVNVAGYKTRRMCTGTLIAPAKVLTAAHCVLDRAGRPFAPADLVFVAGWRAGERAAAVRGAGVLVHPGFLAGILEGGGRNPASDLAVLLLDKPVSGVVPIALGRLAPGMRPGIVGYRMDRPHIASRHRGCAVTAQSARAARTSCRVVPGTSGAPFLAETASGPAVVGVVSAVGPAGTLVALVSSWPEALPLPE